MNEHPAYGIGTTEYMRSVGGCAVTLECRACGSQSGLRVEQLGPRVYARWFALER